MTRSSIGLALGSGSARGWAHIGVIEALAEANIHPDIVCGSSIGALVGAAHVIGELETLREWVGTIGWQDIVRLMDFKLSAGGLIEGRRLMEFFHDRHEDAAIESLSTPFSAVATDLLSGREVWLREGSLVESVRASIALPGLFGPVNLGGRWLVDGGLVNPVPVSVCRALGAEFIIAVNLNGDLVGHHLPLQAAPADEPKKLTPPAGKLEKLLAEFPAGIRNGASTIVAEYFGTNADTPGYFDVLAGSINIMQDFITRSRMAGDPPDILLTPRLAQIGLLEFNRADEAIEEGRNCVRQMLPSLKGLDQDRVF